MSQAATPLITPVATPAVKRRDIPASIMGATFATLAVGYMAGKGLWYINPAEATYAGSLGFHFSCLLKSSIDLIGGGFDGFANRYWLASQQVGLTSLWRVGVAYSLALTAGVFAYKAMAVEIDPIKHYRGRKLVSPDVLDAESKANEEIEGGKIIQFGEVQINKERVARSLAFFGSTGGGKTVCINNVAEDLDENGYSLLIVDGPKGDFASNDGFYLKALRIAPWHCGAVWDIAADCPTRAAARELARHLIPTNEKDAFWTNCAQFSFVVAVCFLIETKGKKWGWGDLWKACAADIETMKERADLYYPPAAAVFADAESKTTNSVMINFKAFMADIYEMSLAWGNVPEDWVRFSFADWLMERGESGKKQHVIIQTSAEWKSTSSAFAGGVIGLLSKIIASPSLKESKTRKKALIIDEFGQLQKLEVNEILELGRSKNVSLIIGTQSPQQIIKIYGEETLDSWFAMLGVRVFVRTLGTKDQEWVAKQISKREIDTPTNSVSASAGGFTTTNSYQRGEEWVIHPSDLQKLGVKKALGGVKVVVDGWDDVSVTLVKFPNFKAVREPFDLNPHWNTTIRGTTTPIIEQSSTLEIEVEEAEIEEIEHKNELILIDDNTNLSVLESENAEDGISEKAGESAVEPSIDAAAAALIGCDVHGIGQILSLADEILGGSNDGNQPQITPVTTQNTVKKTQFMSRKQMKQQQKEDEKA